MEFKLLQSVNEILYSTIVEKESTELELMYKSLLPNYLLKGARFNHVEYLRINNPVRLFLSDFKKFDFLNKKIFSDNTKPSLIQDLKLFFNHKRSFYDDGSIVPIALDELNLAYGRKDDRQFFILYSDEIAPIDQEGLKSVFIDRIWEVESDHNKFISEAGV